MKSWEILSVSISILKFSVFSKSLSNTVDFFLFVLIKHLLNNFLLSNFIICFNCKSNWKLVLLNFNPAISKIPIIFVFSLISFDDNICSFSSHICIAKLFNNLSILVLTKNFFVLYVLIDEFHLSLISSKLGFSVNHNSPFCKIIFRILSSIFSIKLINSKCSLSNNKSL